jgi:hypothetical protein
MSEASIQQYENDFENGTAQKKPVTKSVTG